MRPVPRQVPNDQRRSERGSHASTRRSAELRTQLTGRTSGAADDAKHVAHQSLPLMHNTVYVLYYGGMRESPRNATVSGDSLRRMEAFSTVSERGCPASHSTFIDFPIKLRRSCQIK